MVEMSTVDQSKPYEKTVGAAFFVGKLNKSHNREKIYNALRTLGRQHDFYIRKLDMPYADSRKKKGNRGYCFVHCRSQEEVDRVVALKFIKLGNQKCEVKAYDGRESGTSKLKTSKKSATSVKQSKNEEISETAEATEPETSTTASETGENQECWLVESGSDSQTGYDSEPLESGSCSTEKCEETSVAQESSDLSVTSELGDCGYFSSDFEATNVSNYLDQCLAVASKEGKIVEFFQTYFDAYQNALVFMQGMTQEELNSLAHQYAPLTQQCCL